MISLLNVAATALGAGRGSGDVRSSTSAALRTLSHSLVAVPSSAGRSASPPLSGRRPPVACDHC
jgi:hypothetical protein